MYVSMCFLLKIYFKKKINYILKETLQKQNKTNSTINWGLFCKTYYDGISITLS